MICESGASLYKHDWVTVDARHDARQERLLEEWKGTVFEHPERWEARAALHRRMNLRRQRMAEAHALARYVQGENTDLYGHEEVMQGQEYRDFLRVQRREQARKRRQRGKALTTWSRKLGSRSGIKSDS